MTTVDRIADPWGSRTPYGRGQRWPTRVDTYLADGLTEDEEYYTLALIGHGSIGTNHMDGNTRLCTATAAAALKQSFGCDGQPGSYTDIDHADVIALYGHNMAETQTVTWTRILDRLAGPNPPAVICVDPRRTPVAPAATRLGDPCSDGAGPERPRTARPLRTLPSADPAPTALGERETRGDRSADGHHRLSDGTVRGVRISPRARVCATGSTRADRPGHGA